MRLVRRLLLGMLLATLSVVGNAQQMALSVGVFPYLSTRQLMETYQPMREYLEQHLGGRQVNFYTARDFASFVRRTQAGEYDIVATAPHFARLAQTGAGYQPLLAYGSEISAAIVVNRSAKIVGLAQLRGKKIVAPDRIALVTMTGLRSLRDQGLEPGRDFSLQWAATHGNVALAVLHGDADAGIMSLPVLRQMPEATASQLDTLAASAPTASMVLLARSQMAQPDLATVREVLLRFEQDERGRKFFAATGLRGFKPLNSADLAALEPFAAEVRNLLESTR